MAVEGRLYCCSEFCNNEGAGFVVQRLRFEGAEELLLEGVAEGAEEYVVVIFRLVAMPYFLVYGISHTFTVC